jgi:hypothetical protein
MIVFQLRCGTGHSFEAWFRDSEAFDRQQAASEVRCPVCGDGQVVKAPMAPHVARSTSRAVAPEPGEKASGDDDRRTAPTIPADVWNRAVAELRQHIESRCEYVGERFAEEARRIHYNETASRDIYGEATPKEAAALHDEGIDVQQVPWFVRRND